MDALLDLVSLLAGLITQLWLNSRGEFFAAAAVGVILAAFSWWLAYFVSFSFNRQFSFRPEHYFYCGVAATVTFLFSIVFFALHYTADVAKIMVSAWEVGIQVDQPWADDTFQRAYEGVRALQTPTGKPLEDFSKRPDPKTGLPTSIPTTQEASKLRAADIYAEAAVTHFRIHHPVLSKVLWAHPKIAQDQIYADMHRVFDAGSPNYAAKDAVRLAGKEIRRGLEQQVPRIVLLSRIALVIAFLIVQGITFFLLIHAALADIKVRRAAPPRGGR